jgi:hypothetical protein
MTLMRLIICALVVSIGTIGTLPLASAQTEDAVSLEDFNERLSKDVPVSGRLLVGVVVMPTEGTPARALPTPKLFWNSQSPKDPLCVTFASRDGQYYGEGKLTTAILATKEKPFRVSAPHRPEAKRHLDVTPMDDLAVLASKGDCRLGASAGNSTVHVFDLRNDADSTQPKTLRIMLNSMTFTLNVSASIPPGSKERAVVCEPLPEVKRNKAFNTVCNLDVSPDFGKEGKAKLVISRRRYEQAFKPVEFTLIWSVHSN